MIPKHHIKHDQQCSWRCANSSPLTFRINPGLVSMNTEPSELMTIPHRVNSNCFQSCKTVYFAFYISQTWQDQLRQEGCGKCEQHSELCWLDSCQVAAKKCLMSDHWIHKATSCLLSDNRRWAMITNLDSEKALKRQTRRLCWTRRRLEVPVSVYRLSVLVWRFNLIAMVLILTVDIVTKQLYRNLDVDFTP